MFNKWRGYVLNLQGVMYWKRNIDERGNVFFIKQKTNEPIKLYIELLKTGKNFYKGLDAVTGREFAIAQNNGVFILLPSLIRINKTSFAKDSCVLKNASDILSDPEKEEDYVKVSEDFLINSYYCEKIGEETGLSAIPLDMFFQKLQEDKKTNIAFSYKRKKPSN